MKMNENYNTFSSRIIKKNENLVKLILYFKVSLPKACLFYITIILLNFLGIIILTDSFINKTISQSNVNISTILRKITCFELFKSSNIVTYQYISIFIFFILVVEIFLFMKFYRHIKANNNLKNTYIEKFIITISLILIIFSQHFKEFLSLSFFILIFRKEEGANKLFSENISILIVILNALSFIIINIYQYFFLIITNDPFHESVFPLNIRLERFSYFVYFFINNLQGLYYLELLLEESSIFKYVIILLINIIIIIQYYKRFLKFSFNGLCILLIEFLFWYVSVSSIFETLNYLLSGKSGNIIFSFIKIFISLVLIFINNNLKDTYLIKKTQDFIFRDVYNNNYEIDSLYYFQNLIISLNNDRKSFIKLFNLVHSHAVECKIEFCNCKLIDNSLNNSNVLLENILNNMNFNKDAVLNIFFFEYYLYVRQKRLFSYCLISTFLNKENNLSTIQKVNLYFLCFKTVNSMENDYKEYIYFEEIFNNKKIKKIIIKSICSILNLYDSYATYKIEFENTVKCEEYYIDSFMLNKIDNFVANCDKFQKEYKLLKKTIRNFFKVTKCNDYELSIKTIHFFELFNKKTPNSIMKLLINPKLENFQYIKNMYEENRNFQVMVELNNIFKITYFSYKLANAIGYSQNELLGQDIHKIFPDQLKENHKKVILKYLLFEKYSKIVKKTFAFTKFNNILPVLVKACSFPNLSKNICFIINVESLNEDDKKVFYFILSEEFDVISVNLNLDKYYSLSYNLIQEGKMDVLNMFNIIHKSIFDKFSGRLAVIKQMREIKKFFVNFKDIFNLSLHTSNNEIQLNDPVIVLKKSQLTQSSSSRVPINMSNDKLISSNNSPVKTLPSSPQIPILKTKINDSKDLNNRSCINIVKEKLVIINYLQQVLNKSLELDLALESIRKLRNSIRILRNNKFSHFGINITLKNFIDTPFYIVRIHEILKVKDNKNLNSKNLKNLNLIKKLITSSLKNRRNSRRTSKFSGGLFGASFFITEEEVELNNTIANELLQSIDLQFSSNPKKINKKPIQNNLSELKILIIILILLVLLISMRSYLFYYKISSTNHLNTLFEINYWNSIQKTTLNFLQSSVLTFIFHLLNLSKFKQTDPIKSLKMLIKKRSINHQTYFHQLYNKLVYLDENILIESIMKEKFFNKTILNWENIQESSSFFKESKHLNNDINILTLQENYDILIEEIENSYLFEKYRLINNKPQSILGKVIFYLQTNIPKAYMENINIIENYVTENFSKNDENSKENIIIFEIFNQLISLGLIILILINLYKYDKLYFTSIISSLLNINNKENDSFKSTNLSLSFKNRILQFRNYINNIQNEYEIIKDRKAEVIKIIEKIKKETFYYNNYEGLPVDELKKRVLIKIKDSQSETSTEENKDSQENENSTMKKEQNLNIITNQQILSSIKPYHIKLVNITKFVILIIFVLFTSFSLANIFTTINHINTLSKTHTITNSLIMRFSYMCQLFNYVRTSVFNNDPQPNVAFKESYNDLLYNIESIQKNYIEFLNTYSETLPLTWNFVRKIDSGLDQSNEQFLCKNLADLCRLNSKGIDSGISSTVDNLKVIYRDFIIHRRSNISKKDILIYFNTDIFELINLEVENIFELLNDEFMNYIFQDIEVNFNGVYSSVIILSVSTIICNIFIVIYVIFGYMKMLRLYLSMINYSCYKFNNAMFG